MSDEVKQKNYPAKLIVTICDRAKTNVVIKIIQEQCIRFNFATIASGTAGSDIMALLGLESTDKSFVCGLVPECAIGGILEKTSDALQLKKPGKGIAFTMPLTGLNKPVQSAINKDTERCLENAGKSEEIGMERTCKDPREPNRFDLIVTVMNQGHIEELMTAARDAGARGGTVLHGRRFGVGEEESSFLGISVQVEKDIVTILTTHENKNEIMKAITGAVGMNTEARGMIFSLQVDDIVGLGGMEEH